MKRWALFIIALTLISTLALAQATVTPSGQATTQGTAVPSTPISPPLVATPLMHLGVAPTQNVGTSTAAVTSNPSATPEPPSAVPIRPEIDFGPQNVYVGPTNPTADNNANANGNAAVSVNGRQIFDRGVHSSEATSIDDGTRGRSLGDIARESRQRAQSAQARTFTNADLDRMANAGGVSGIATNPNNPTGYPADNGVINPNGVAANAANNNAQPGVATPSNVPPTTEQQVTQPVTPFTAKPQTNTQPQQKPSAAPPTPQQMSQANTPANPADQNGANGQNNGEQKTLPKSGSFLPLMAVVGLGATAAGLLSRK
jgi:hypothetical protein